MRTWTSREARTKLSEVIRRATSEGPQVFTNRGQEVVVFLSKQGYERLIRADVDVNRSAPT